MRAATPGRLLCRINGFGPWTAGEVADAVAAGADEILLPMVRSTDQVDRTLDLRRPAAAASASSSRPRTPSTPPPPWPRGRSPGSTSGSTTCASTAASTELFRPLVDGTVDACARSVPQPVRRRRADPARRRLPGAQRPARRRAGPHRRRLHVPPPRVHRRHGRPRPVRRGAAAARQPSTGCAGPTRPTVAARGPRSSPRSTARGPRPCWPASGRPPSVRALVTGAGGFVGRHLVDRLRRDGWDGRRPDPARGRPRRPGGRHGGRAGRRPRRRVLPRRRPGEGHRRPSGPRRSRSTRARGWSTRCPTGAGPSSGSGSSTEYAASPRPLAEDAALEPRGFFGATKAAGSLLLQATAAERGVRAAVLRAFQVYGPGDHPTRLVPGRARGGPQRDDGAAARAG